MAVKHVVIPATKGQGKPLEICEHEDGKSALAEHFVLTEPEMQQVAEKMRKTLTRKSKDIPR